MRIALLLVFALLPLRTVFGFQEPTPTPSQQQPQLVERGDAAFRALVRDLRPAPRGSEEIQWRSTLAAGVREASAAHKPILLWAMNGHPLGCT